MQSPHVTHVKESCYLYISHVTRHVTHACGVSPCATAHILSSMFSFLMPQTWTSHVTSEWVMSHVMSRMNASCHLLQQHVQQQHVQPPHPPLQLLEIDISKKIKKGQLTQSTRSNENIPNNTFLEKFTKSLLTPFIKKMNTTCMHPLYSWRHLSFSQKSELKFINIYILMNIHICKHIYIYIYVYIYIYEYTHMSVHI